MYQSVTTSPAYGLSVEPADAAHSDLLSEAQARVSETPDISSPPLTPADVVPMLIGATVGEVEQELVLQTLAHCDGNRTHASRVLGISVRTLRNKIRLYAADGIDVPAHI
jgi:DNA-binding NtrC family response regulator